jgi:hypothetical protein
MLLDAAAAAARGRRRPTRPPAPGRAGDPFAAPPSSLSELLNPCPPAAETPASRSADATPVDRATRDASRHLGRLEKSAHKTGAGLKIGLAVGAGAAAGSAARRRDQEVRRRRVEAEKSNAQAEGAAAGDGHLLQRARQEIDAVIQKHSQLAGVDDEDLQDAFTNLVRSTGSVNTAMKDLGLVTDLARAKHIDVAKAGELVAQGPRRQHRRPQALRHRVPARHRRAGQAQGQRREVHRRADAAAKATDKAATSHKALGELQKRFSGQAEAYGKTAAGAQERFGVAVENLQEKLGSKLLPTVTRVTGGVATSSPAWTPARAPAAASPQAISSAFSAVRTGVDRVKAKISDWVTRNRGDINSVVNAFKTVGRFAKEVFQDVMLPIVKRTMNAIGPIVDGLVHTIRGLVRLVSGLLSGNWSKAWSGAKEAVGGAWKAIKTIVVTQAENIWDIIKDLGPKLSGACSPLKNLGTALRDLRASSGAVPGLGGKKGMGSRSQRLRQAQPVRRRHRRSPAATRSWAPARSSRRSRPRWPAASGCTPQQRRAPGRGHGQRQPLLPRRRVRDRRGRHPAGMLAYFRYLKASSARVLRELIYTPGGVGIKDGKPYQYTGAVAADHYDHVHVAFTGAAAASGDGDRPRPPHCGPGRRHPRDAEPRDHPQVRAGRGAGGHRPAQRRGRDRRLHAGRRRAQDAHRQHRRGEPDRAGEARHRKADRGQRVADGGARRAHAGPRGPVHRVAVERDGRPVARGHRRPPAPPA